MTAVEIGRAIHPVWPARSRARPPGSATPLRGGRHRDGRVANNPHELISHLRRRAVITRSSSRPPPHGRSGERRGRAPRWTVPPPAIVNALDTGPRLPRDPGTPNAFMEPVKFTLTGRSATSRRPDGALLDVLRDQCGLTGTKEAGEGDARLHRPPKTAARRRLPRPSRTPAAPTPHDRRRRDTLQDSS